MDLIVFSHIFFAIGLFFCINLIGQHSPSNFGYYQLTLFLQTEEAPAFNFVIRVLTPSVFIILVSTAFYSLKLDDYTKNIYLISVYYVIFRSIFNISINRAKLINWPRQFLYSLSVVGLSYFVYNKLIVTKANILPNFDNISNEIWIIIIIFLYNLINSIQISDSKLEKRKQKYIENRFLLIDQKYGRLIKEPVNNIRLQQIVYAIILYEDFNRPKLFRLIEYISFYLTKRKHTLGIMQVRTDKIINDKESVMLGVKKIQEDYNTLKEVYSKKKENLYDRTCQIELIEMFNTSATYSSEILELADQINKKYFHGTTNLFFKDDTGME